MTLLEIIERALINLGEDTDADTVEEYKDEYGIVGYINHAYFAVVENDWKPYKTATVTLNADSMLDFSDIPDLREIVSIKSGEVLPVVEYGEASDKIKVYTDASSDVDVKYYYSPDALANDDDEPVFPSQYHDALSDFAAYRILITGTLTRQQRAQAFYIDYAKKRGEIREAASKRLKIVHQNKFHNRF